MWGVTLQAGDWTGCPSSDVREREGLGSLWCADFRCVSRSRFWGTPLPIWASKDMEELVVISSIAQLEELTGEKVTSLCKLP